MSIRTRTVFMMVTIGSEDRPIPIKFAKSFVSLGMGSKPKLSYFQTADFNPVAILIL